MLLPAICTFYHRDPFICWLLLAATAYPQVTPGSDVYSFGVLMWSSYTGEHPYVNLDGEWAPNHLFPHFHSSGCYSNDQSHAQYKALAGRCLQTDPHLRPSFVQIDARLSVILGQGQPGPLLGQGRPAPCLSLGWGPPSGPARGQGHPSASQVAAVAGSAQPTVADAAQPAGAGAAQSAVAGAPGPLVGAEADLPSRVSGSASGARPSSSRGDSAGSSRQPAAAEVMQPAAAGAMQPAGPAPLRQEAELGSSSLHPHPAVAGVIHASAWEDEAVASLTHWTSRTILASSCLLQLQSRELAKQSAPLPLFVVISPCTAEEL